MLGHLLETLGSQETEGMFDYSIVVVDNDNEQSARETVERAEKTARVSIQYDVEAIQNISMARNKALRTDRADYYACIDDDEYADPSWLISLYKIILAYSADGVLGPVISQFEVPPPRWIVEGSIFDRGSFPSGKMISDVRYTRSGNFMISRRIVDENSLLFNPEYGLIGGEDSDFFGRMIRQGYSFVWCQEARVYETVPASRLTRTYQLRRALMRGVAAAKRTPAMTMDTARSMIASVLYTIALPVLLVVKPSLFMPFAIRDCDHVGKLLARIGIRPVRRWLS
jgi:succinoglycan biosynthesis protein ExoM